MKKAMKKKAIKSSSKKMSVSEKMCSCGSGKASEGCCGSGKSCCGNC